MRGELADAVAKYAADEAIRSRLSAADPKDGSRRDNLLTVHAILGRTQALAGDIAPGMQRLAACRRHGRAAGDTRSGQRRVPGTRSLVWHAAGAAAPPHGRPSRREPPHRKIAGRVRAAHPQDTDNTAWRREQAEAMIEHAAQLRAAGDTPRRGNKPKPRRDCSDLAAAAARRSRHLLATVDAGLAQATVTTDAEAAQPAA